MGHAEVVEVAAAKEGRSLAVAAERLAGTREIRCRLVGLEGRADAVAPRKYVGPVGAISDQVIAETKSR